MRIRRKLRARDPAKSAVGIGSGATVAISIAEKNLEDLLCAAR